VSFAAITLCVASQRVIQKVSLYFVIDSVRKRLDTRSHLFIYLLTYLVGIALSYGLDDQGPRVRFPAGAGNFSLHHSVQNGSGAHPVHPLPQYAFMEWCSIKKAQGHIYLLTYLLSSGVSIPDFCFSVCCYATITDLYS
jgi:hypothetical protein